MSDRTLVMERLENVLEALEKILRRVSNVHSVDDFVLSEAGRNGTAGRHLHASYCHRRGV